MVSVPVWLPVAAARSSTHGERKVAPVSRRKRTERSIPNRVTSTLSRFPPSARLLAADEFRRVFQKPVKSTDHLFTVLCRARSVEDGVPGARLGLAIAKKQLKRAVDRNRIKRLIRESFRETRADMESADFVVMARNRVATEPNPVLRAALNRHWRRIAKLLAA